MNGFFRKAVHRVKQLQKEHKGEIEDITRRSKKLLESAKKQGEKLHVKMRIEGELMRGKLSDKANLDMPQMHNRWVQFRNKHLSTSANQLLQQVGVFSRFSKKKLTELQLEKHLKDAQYNLAKRGINTEQLNRIASRGWLATNQAWRFLQQQATERKLDKFFYTPINYLASAAQQKAKKLFIGILLVSFCYGAGSYIPVAVKDYYVQKKLLESYESLRKDQQLLLEEKRLAYQMARLNAVAAIANQGEKMIQSTENQLQSAMEEVDKPIPNSTQIHIGSA